MMAELDADYRIITRRDLKGLFGLAASTTVGKSGDSLDIRISKKVAEFVNLQKGQTVMVHPEGKNKIIITF